jgi:hypothetical protein
MLIPVPDTARWSLGLSRVPGVRLLPRARRAAGARGAHPALWSSMPTATRVTPARCAGRRRRCLCDV